MKNSTVIVLGALIVLSAFLLFMNYKSDEGAINDNISNNFSKGVLEVSENDFNFGTIRMGDGIVVHEFEVINKGTESVQIGEVYTSCACTTAYIADNSGKKTGKFGMPGHSGLRTSADLEVAPGESITVEAVYDPAFHGPSAVGLAQRTIYLETNSINIPTVKLDFEATVIR